jgi:type II secretory pathway component PulF
MAIGVSLFLMTFVVPKLLVGLEQAGRRPPLITQVVKALSDGLIGYWWALLIAAAALVGAAGALLCTPRGRWWADALMLRLPLIGLMLRKQAVVRIATVIAALMRSGIEFVAAVRIAQRTTGNRVLRAALGRCEQAVVAGQDIGAALEATGAFPRTAVQVFAIGQQAGRLEPMLERLAADYDRQLTSLTGRLVSLLEPLLIVIMVLIVGFIAFATILPMLEASHVLT